MKYYVTKKADIGKQGPGQYVYESAPKKRKCITVLGSEELTDQAQAHLTDVSKLLEPAIKNGLLRHSTHFSGEYDDIPAIDFQQAMDTVAKGTEMFEALPPQIRNRFKGDIKEFLNYTQNPDNFAEMQKFGMVKGNDGFRADGITPSGAPTDLNKDGRMDTVDTNADGVPDSNPAPQ
jgi:phage internal scaffolding protein